jgi:mono/diheme cytochrome c family protein
MNKSLLLIVAALALICLGAFKAVLPRMRHEQLLADTTKRPAKFGFGRTATAQEIAAWDIAIRPDGKGLPAGQGNTTIGSTIYAQKCVACHGTGGTDKQAVKLLGPVLISDTVLKSRPKAIGNYWPYATTLFDYIRRAMPYNQPGSLTNDEVYSITAYLLSANHVIKPDKVLNAKTLPQIVMPAKKLFIMDDRRGGPEVK